MAQSLPPHTGLLREENLALRYLLGYSTDTLTSSLFHDAKLDEKLPNSPINNNSVIKDVLLVSIVVRISGGYEAFKNPTNDEPQQWHIGISTFDTRFLLNAMTHPDSVKPEIAIQSYLFLVGKGRDVDKARRRFLFGDPEEIPLSQFKSKFDLLTQNREYVMVVHGLSSYPGLLESLEVGSRACCKIDTVKALQFPLALHYRYSLEDFMYAMQIPYKLLGVMGNRTQFILRGC